MTRVAMTALFLPDRKRARLLVIRALRNRLAAKWTLVIAVPALVWIVVLVSQIPSSEVAPNSGAATLERDADIENLRSFAASISLGPGAANTTQGTPSLPDVDTLIERLELRLRNMPGDSEGWRMLGWSYFHTDRFEKAVDAYAKAWQLRPQSIELGAGLVEAMIVRDGGTVNDASREVLASVLKLDPAMPMARFYMALAKSQRGQRAEALADMRSLAGTVHDEASPWVEQLASQIEALSAAMPGAVPSQPSQ